MFINPFLTPTISQPDVILKFIKKGGRNNDKVFFFEKEG